MLLAFGTVSRVVVGIACAFLAIGTAVAEDCPANPNAIGTSRVIVITPGKITRVGVMQYQHSLPLANKEVVLTFDDGPLPPYTNQILDILASECVRATYFLVGRMARSFPSIVRRIQEAGHTVGTHSEDHPSQFQSLSVAKVRQ
jgi:peptidoglycan-N-acetylglucosamine deacetylase